MKTKKIIIGICIFLVAVMAAGAAYAKFELFKKYSYEPVRVNFAQTCGTRQEMDSILIASLGKSFGSSVSRLTHLMGVKPQEVHGSYQVSPGMTAIKFARNLKYRRQTPVRLIFNNLRYLSDLSAKVASVLEMDSAAFMRGCREVLVPLGYNEYSMPAAFLPDTYEFFWTDSPSTVVKKLHAEHDRFWTEERRKKAKELGFNTTEVATIASIVEEETNKREERPAIARVYMNRVYRDMFLQADPTIKYVLGDWSIRRVVNPERQVDSPYNTYTQKGLPPGPIRIVDRTSLDAVLNAPEHNYVYMCAKPDFSGYHNFAETYPEHRINAQNYHRALDARGIKNF